MTKRAIAWGIACVALCRPIYGETTDAEKASPHPTALATIAVDVTLLRLEAAQAEDLMAELNGPRHEIAGIVRHFEEEGQAVLINRIRLVTLENQKTMVQFGGTIPVATSRSFAGGRGGPQTSYQLNQVGTMVAGTATVDGDAVVIDLQIEKSQLAPHASGDDSDKDEFAPVGIDTFTAHVAGRIEAGQTRVVNQVDEAASNQATQQLILVSAQILNSPADMPQATSDQQHAALKVFALQNSDANEIAKIFRGLFDPKQQNVRIGADKRTNSLIVSTSDLPLLDKIEALLMHLDALSP